MSPISGVQDFRRFQSLCDDAEISVYGKLLISSLHSGDNKLLAIKEDSDINVTLDGSTYSD